MTKKIALIGSAPSSVRFGPYAKPDWEVWACSPGAYPHISPTRPNAWFELHRFEPPWGYTGPKPWFSNEYIAYMSKLACPVYMIEPVPEIPTSRAYPKDEMLEKFGPFFFGSSLSWMFALAITAGATEIELYGVDMSANEEWYDQRQGCHYFISIARAMGISVTVPHESDLFLPCPLYGFKEVDPMHIKLASREAEIKARIADARNRQAAAEHEIRHLEGALDNMTYVMKTWITDPLQKKLAYANPEPPKPEKTEAVEIIPPVRPNGKHPHDLHGIAE